MHRNRCRLVHGLLSLAPYEHLGTLGARAPKIIKPVSPNFHSNPRPGGRLPMEVFVYSVPYLAQRASCHVLICLPSTWSCLQTLTASLQARVYQISLVKRCVALGPRRRFKNFSANCFPLSFGSSEVGGTHTLPCGWFSSPE